MWKVSFSLFLLLDGASESTILLNLKIKAVIKILKDWNPSKVTSYTFWYVRRNESTWLTRLENILTAGKKAKDSKKFLRHYIAIFQPPHLFRAGVVMKPQSCKKRDIAVEKFSYCKKYNRFYRWYSQKRITKETVHNNVKIEKTEKAKETCSAREKRASQIVSKTLYISRWKGLQWLRNNSVLK